MRMKRVILLMLAPALLLLGAACSSDDEAAPGTPAVAATLADGEPIKIGMILVGPRDDRGWSQAHLEGGQYAANALGGELIVIDKVNPADSPNVTIPQVVEDMIAQGVDLIFATSDDMRDGILEAAALFPNVPMIWASGDNAWADGKGHRPDLANLGNIMGEMEYGKMIAGCAAALQSESGKISYLGPLVNDETRRLVNSTYLGARHCWTEVRGNDVANLAFNVTWIGFWFNIPGVTLDPTQVVNEFHANGTDVIVSGIDTTEAIVRTGQVAAEGRSVWAVPYDYEAACDQAPQVCLGVPYFHWGPSYLETARAVVDGTFAPTFRWIGPDWSDINNPDTTAIGFLKGDGLTEANAALLDTFIGGLADGSINLWQGPLNFQDGSPFLAAGATATPLQIWYMPALLQGIEGAAAAN
jgi:simple sugar transport system substrate-binding protein